VRYLLVFYTVVQLPENQLISHLNPTYGETIALLDRMKPLQAIASLCKSFRLKLIPIVVRGCNYDMLIHIQELSSQIGNSIVDPSLGSKAYWSWIQF